VLVGVRHQREETRKRARLIAVSSWRW